MPCALYRRGVSVRGSPRQRLPGQRPRTETPPLVNRMTHTSKNITLPQTSFAGGNDNDNHMSCISRKFSSVHNLLLNHSPTNY